MSPVLEPAVTAPATRRFPALDGLRGFAILAVLFHHLFLFTPTGVVSSHLFRLVDFCSHGVDVFFVLSGFLIARQLVKGRTDPSFPRRFWVRRLAKIVPLYATVVLLLFAVVEPLVVRLHQTSAFWWMVREEHRWPWFALFLTNLKIARDGAFTHPGLDLTWSLAIEVQFYLAAFLLARLFRPAQWPALALAAIAAAIVARCVEFGAGANWIQIVVLSPGRMDAFAFGIIAAIVPQWLARFPAMLVGGVVALPLVIPWSRANPFVEIIGYTIVAFAAGLVVERAARPAALKGWLRVFTWRGLVFVGRISYSLYLIHLPLRSVLRDRFVPSGDVARMAHPWLIQAAYTVSAGTCCLVAGWLTWRCFEDPLRRWLIGRFSSRAEQPVWEDSAGLRGSSSVAAP